MQVFLCELLSGHILCVQCELNEERLVSRFTRMSSGAVVSATNLRYVSTDSNLRRLHLLTFTEDSWLGEKPRWKHLQVGALG